MTRVKICGLTNLQDAQVAIAAGADLLGFNFYRPSPRYIAPHAAAAIIAELRVMSGHNGKATLFQGVGVFVNAPLDEVLAIQSQCALDLLQLSGDETPEYLRAIGKRAFKGLRPATQAAAHAELLRFTPVSGAREPTFLLDGSHAQLYGGTGKTADWALAREIAGSYPILLAGGLTPTNVASAIGTVQPWGVDVASGVEQAPGMKDRTKMRDFIQAAKGTIHG